MGIHGIHGGIHGIHVSPALIRDRGYTGIHNTIGVYPMYPRSGGTRSRTGIFFRFRKKRWAGAHWPDLL